MSAEEPKIEFGKEENDQLNRQARATALRQLELTSRPARGTREYKEYSERKKSIFNQLAKELKGAYRLQHRQRHGREIPIVNSTDPVRGNPDFEQPDQEQHKSPKKEHTD